MTHLNVEKMDTLYAIVSSYYNGAEVWETVEDIYQDNDDAELRVLELIDRAKEIGNTDTDYYVREYKLK